MRAKKLFALFSVCLCLTAAGARADGKQDAGNFANTLGHNALSIITNNGLSKSDKQTKLEELFAQNVDIDWIGKFVLGRNWKSATDAQKQEYLTNYRSFTIKHYTTNISDFTDANFEVAKVRDDDQGGYVVTMRIKRPQSEDVITEFDVRPQQGDGLRVYDITVEGVSMITTQRSEFNSVVSNKGLDYLIAQLKARSQQDAGIAKEGQ
jgi:phospholipid transport system substrate-binding protein